MKCDIPIQYNKIVEMLATLTHMEMQDMGKEDKGRSFRNIKLYQN